MKRTTAAAIFVTSIVVFPTAVKSRAADLPNVSPASRKTDLKDSVKDDAKKNLFQLIDFMMSNGTDVQLGEGVAAIMGLPGAMPAKSKNIRDKSQGKERSALNCIVIYEKTSDASVSDGKKPSCVYLMKVTESPSIKDGQFFRVSLDGQLERVITSRVKKDGDGKIIPGSSVELDDDLDSSAVRKTYAAEMREVKVWLKAQQKLAAKKTTANAAKSAAVATTGAAPAQATP